MPSVYDETFRDGPQSVWGSRMDTEEMLRIAPAIDAAGFSKSVVVSGATFESAIRQSRQDPWTRVERISAAMQSTTPIAQIRGRSLFGWQQHHDDVVELFMTTLVERGIRGFLVYDALNDPTMIATHLRVARELGVPAWVLVCFSLSPAHTEEYWIRTLRRIAELGADGITVVDASGLMDPATVPAFLATCREALAGTNATLELNVHDLTGRGRACYEAATAAGIDGLAAVAGPLAHGLSIPSWAEAVRATGADIDLASLADVEDFLAWVGHVRGHAVSRSELMTDDQIKRYEQHQVPGGMVSNLKRQLAELDLSDLLPAVLDEIPVVRAELGYPTMVTPASQFVGVQATMNVLSGGRYNTWPTELVSYLSGEHGVPPGLVDQGVMDRVLGDRKVTAPDWTAPMLTAPIGRPEDALTDLFYGDAVMTAFRAEERSIGAVDTSADVELVRALLERVRPKQLKYVRGHRA